MCWIEHYTYCERCIYLYMDACNHTKRFNRSDSYCHAHSDHYLHGNWYRIERVYKNSNCNDHG